MVESVKAASEIYRPSPGTVTAVNRTCCRQRARASSTPPETDGWIFKHRPRRCRRTRQPDGRRRLCRDSTCRHRCATFPTPLHERADMLGGHRRRRPPRTCSPRVPRTALLSKPGRPARATRPSSWSRPICSALAGQNHAAGDGPFFVGAGAYRHHVPASGRSPDPALANGSRPTRPTSRRSRRAPCRCCSSSRPRSRKITGMEVANASHV